MTLVIGFSYVIILVNILVGGSVVLVVRTFFDVITAVGRSTVVFVAISFDTITFREGSIGICVYPKIEGTPRTIVCLHAEFPCTFFFLVLSISPIPRVLVLALSPIICLRVYGNYVLPVHQ